MANTIKEKELRTSYDEQEAADSTKKVGHKVTLEATNGSLYPKRKKKGIDY